MLPRSFNKRLGAMNDECFGAFCPSPDKIQHRCESGRHIATNTRLSVDQCTAVQRRSDQRAVRSTGCSTSQWQVRE